MLGSATTALATALPYAIACLKRADNSIRSGYFPARQPPPYGRQAHNPHRPRFSRIPPCPEDRGRYFLASQGRAHRPDPPRGQPTKIGVAGALSHRTRCDKSQPHVLCRNVAAMPRNQGYRGASRREALSSPQEFLGENSAVCSVCRPEFDPLKLRKSLDSPKPAHLGGRHGAMRSKETLLVVPAETNCLHRTDDATYCTN
ncbi:hypothetical protein Hsar01_01220 [Haloferula sargassicola]|uniref:Uncharacterized protein n=1 Tax=Haloferula sargassicola TaxID=490096 RepID=A0ABP9UL62_9BACT